MRNLILLRGSPGCGKSTWIHDRDLDKFTLCADSIRLMLSAPVLKPNGDLTITQECDQKVWGLLFDMLETRMSRGEFTVIDATNSKTSEMVRYKQLADKYRYRIFCVDFTNVPIDVAKERNSRRDPYKYVPESVIDTMYARFATHQVPSGIKVIKPEEFLDTICCKPLDLSKYKKIHHIGDIHGCNTPLQQYFSDQGGIKDDEFYIFLGDYIDRGTENAEVVDFLLSIVNRDNVILLQGNHEEPLGRWTHGDDVGSKIFRRYTQAELEAHGTDKKKVRELYRRLCQLVYYKHGKLEVLCTHGGIPKLPGIFAYVSTQQLIRGAGEYKDAYDICKTWYQFCPSYQYQLFGHRNIEELPAAVQIHLVDEDRDVFSRCFNLEGNVEHGGKLRVVTLHNEEGISYWETSLIQNNIESTYEPEPEEQAKAAQRPITSTGSLVSALRTNKFVQEKHFGDISSFNFTRAAFSENIWNNQTVRSRGLFINTTTDEIVMRSYNKFFDISHYKNKLNSVLKFPVKTYVKENGFLGVCGYDADAGLTVTGSKSSLTGPFADTFRKLLYQTVDTADKTGRLKALLSTANVSLVFEVIDPLLDPHIIKYIEPHLVLLDAVYRDLEYHKVSYEELVSIGEKFGFEVKHAGPTFDTVAELTNWCDYVATYDYMLSVDNSEPKHIEGFVLEDADGTMIKVKSGYYTLWKQMRGVANSLAKYGQYQHTSSLTTPLANYVYGFLKKQSKEDLSNTSIIELRHKFYEELGNERL